MASDLRFFVEYAKRNCNCKECKKGIGKGELRIMFRKFDVGVTNQHFHPECIFKTFTPRKRVKIQSESDVGGWNDVKSKDANIVKKLIKKYGGAATNVPTKGSKAKPASTSKKRTVAKQDDEDEDEEEEEDAPTATAPKAKKAKNTTKKKPAAKVLVKAAATVPAVVVPAATPPAAATSTSSPKKKGELDDEVKREFCRLSVTGGITAKDFNQFSVSDLKAVLKLNDRATTGNKGDLCKAVADCMKNGCPPRCTECGGGRLRVKPNGSFRCPGYMEDDEFQFCTFTAAKGDVARIPWTNPK